MACQRCGQCCYSYSIGIPKNDDIRRWFTYHGLIVRDMDEESMGVLGHSRCEMLLFTDDARTACAVYENRPGLCAEFLCPRAKEET